MSAGWVAFAAVLGANALLTGFLALRVSRQSHVPGSRAFTGTMVALAIWAGGYACETLAPSVEAKTGWLRLENVGIATLVPLFFLFALRYTGANRAVSRRAAGVVFVVPVLTLLILFFGTSASLHHASVRPFADSGGPLVVSGGPWYPDAVHQPEDPEGERREVNRERKAGPDPPREVVDIRGPRGGDSQEKDGGRCAVALRVGGAWPAG